MSNENADTIKLSYPIDLKFVSLIDDFKGLSQRQVYHLMIGRHKAFRDEMREQFEDYCRNHPLWGSLNDEEEDYQVFENRSKALHEHWVDLLWLYYRLRDYRSRHILFAVINNWYYFDLNSLNYVREPLYHTFFDPDIMKCDENEVLVDMGALYNDSVIKYMSTYNVYKRIYCYENSPETTEALAEKMKKYKNVVVSGNAAYEKVIPGREFSGKTVTIDEDIKEPVTFIKMNLHGYEQKALLGCAGHIKDDKPKLAVAIHHNTQDIWKIPRMIDEICPGYNYYLRYHGKSFYPTDLSLLAVFGEDIINE